MRKKLTITIIVLVFLFTGTCSVMAEEVQTPQNSTESVKTETITKEDKALKGTAKKTVRHKHKHSLIKRTIRKPGRYVYGIARYSCRNCSYSHTVRIKPTSVGRYMLYKFKRDLSKAKRYEKRKLKLKRYKKRKALRPVNKITKPRYMKDKDGIYKSSSVKKNGVATIMIAGDSMCQPRQIKASRTKNGKYRFNDEFSVIRKTLRKSDFAVTNLETMLSDSSAFSSETLHVGGVYHCNGPSTFLGGLRYAGFDMAVTANNHNCDTGVQGLFETLTHLDQYGFIHTGMFRNKDEKRYKIVMIDGIKVAFLSYSKYFNGKNRCWTETGQDILLNRFTSERVERDVAAVKRKGAEYVIGYIHAGKCFTHKQTASQNEAYQAMADAGVDYIVTAHPHVLQKYKTVKSAEGRTVPVMCSLGNFVSHMQETSDRYLSAILRIKLKRNKSGKVYLAGQGYIPIKTYSIYKKHKYVVVPLTKPYSRGSLSFDSKARKNYKKIVRTIGKRIKVLGDFAK